MWFENGLETTMLTFIAIIGDTIYCATYFFYCDRSSVVVYIYWNHKDFTEEFNQGSQTQLDITVFRFLFVKKIVNFIILYFSTMQY